MSRLIIIFLLVLLFSLESLADWTITGKTTEISNSTVIVELDCLSDGTDPAAFNLLDVTGIRSSSLSKILGRYFYQIDCEVLVAPDAVWTLAVSKEDGAGIISYTDMAITSSTRFVYEDLGAFPKILDPNLAIDIGDIGSSGDHIILKLIF